MLWETLLASYCDFPFYAAGFLSLIGLRIWLGGNLSCWAIAACYALSLPVLGAACFVNGPILTALKLLLQIPRPLLALLPGSVQVVLRTNTTTDCSVNTSPSCSLPPASGRCSVCPCAC